VIDISKEKLQSLAALARTLPPGRLGRGVHPSTLTRWARRGLRGIRLETIQAGGRMCSSLEALARFFAALSSPPQLDCANAVQPTSSRAAIELDKLIGR
jgi:hypothetical protein